MGSVEVVITSTVSNPERSASLAWRVITANRSAGPVAGRLKLGIW